MGRQQALYPYLDTSRWSFGTIYNNNLHELQDYMTLDGHVYGTDFLLINEDFFQSLSPAEQEVVQKAAIVAGNMGRSIQQFTTAVGVNAVQEEGMQVYSPTSEELAMFAEAAQPAVKEWLAGELGEQSDWITRLEEAVANATD